MDPQRLQAAYQQARGDLLDARVVEGTHWEGRLSASALSTATAISALAMVLHAGPSEGTPDPNSRHTQLMDRGIRWLVHEQNPDGGWGDTDKSHSNISTTILARAALVLSGRAEEVSDCMGRAESYIADRGGVEGVRQRYGRDKTFAVPILANSALAGLVPWKEVAALPFELACFPQEMYRFLRMPVVSYAIPALVAVGQARYHHHPPRNPVIRLLRAASKRKSLEVLKRMQPHSGGYLEAVPLTSFVVMNLASIGQRHHPVAQDGVRFIEDSVREDGSWPIDTNLATWNTTLSLNALAAGGEDITHLASLDWLLDCQHRSIHPFTGADPGGWGWSDLSGAVPDADDTPSALLTLATWNQSSDLSMAVRQRITIAAAEGTRWLLNLQNRDGGWPTFCRGWGKLPFDRSGADLTAHALRALFAWQSECPAAAWEKAIRRGLRYLRRTQRADGSWLPLWFGNQDMPDEENPVYGTARVLLAWANLDRLTERPTQWGCDWLHSNQNEDGGWGGGPSVRERHKRTGPSSVEETAVAVEALIRCQERPFSPPATVKGLEWLVDAVEQNRHQDSSPIGFYFAKLWYYERLYPAIFTVSALGTAIRHTPRSPLSEAN